MTIPSLTPLSTPPSRTTGDFDEAMDTTLVELDAMVDEFNDEVIPAMNALASDIDTKSGSATTAATNAATSEANALASKNAAATSATSAAASATAAGTSATNAATSASTATTKATSATTSATNAATSETNALASKNAAATSATNAANSATAAGISATNAATSATAAGTSATNAATSASTATTKATSATTSAANAATSEANALASKNDAATSATNAAAAASSAASSASNAAAAVAGLNMPSATAADAGKHLVVKQDGTGYELQTIHAGCCRLALYGSNLLLSRYNGAKLVIDNLQRDIPAAGVSLAPTGLSANTTYYIYASMASGQMVLEASTTGHAVDVRNGVEVKSGDPSRSLVGMARTTSGTAWADSATQRFVASYFNRKRKQCQSLFTGLSTASSSSVELSSAKRAEFVSFESDSLGWFVCTGSNTSGMDLTGALGVDGVTGQTVSINAPSNSLTYLICNPPIGVSISEGYHYVTMMGRAVYGGTSSYSGFVACEVWG